ncbi:FAD-binding oxidoreductase [Pseudonocardia hydrocarbonoxydans]|uniref:FAD-linked oxidase n=1 Tax=Pseudonocardia hydrocarbonoxydans TaxID=76726 RepID=A0A4Y3WRR8_9PSEU|nr:FAD-binding oxidoreductase [Pseudonocardia hydrocarbonoxydans]GEC21208.1 FAD-linked oxidase [Pseudonocardia hydrocarbonoxydans]
MTRADTFDELRAAMDGSVLVPGDPDYDGARLIWNGAIDRYPAVVARCTSPADVAEALACARDRGLEVAVRGGGHGYWGAAVPEQGLMIDLSPLDGVVVDPVARRARVGGGAKLAQLDAACQEHGLAVPAGTVSHTGVGGLTLGGGFGWLTPLHGLSIDNLESAEVVLADGTCVRASADEHPDLFWALRGGGGNFGVVTEFEFRLHPVGPIVHLGMLFVEQDRAAHAIRTARDAFGSVPTGISPGIAGICAPPAPFVPERHHGAPGVAAIMVGFGTAEEHAAALAPLREALDPLFEVVMPLPYVALQQMLDEGTFWGIRAYTKGLYLDELPDAAVDVLADRLSTRTSPLSELLIFPFGGAYAEVADADTAFGGSRSMRYVVAIEGMAPDPEAYLRERQWVRDTWDALRPAAVGPGTYVNLMSEADEGALRAAYGSEKYERLSRIKARYDPGNVFSVNANIKPA